MVKTANVFLIKIKNYSYMKKSKKFVNVYKITINEIPTVVNFFDYEVNEEDLEDDEYEFFEEELLEIAKE